MKRDLHSTITGWAWLDKLTLPFWHVYCKIQEWRFCRELGHGDAEKGRQILREAVAEHDREVAR